MGKKRNDGKMSEEEIVTHIKRSEKSPCTISRADFLDKARPILITVDGAQKICGPKEFATGSFGWHCSDKTVATVNGEVIKVQINCTLVVVGSKDV